MQCPIRLVRRVLEDLTAARVLSPVVMKRNTIGYQPARPVADLSIAKVLQLLNHNGVADLPIADSPSVKSLKERLVKLEEEISGSSANLDLAALAAS